MSGHIYLAFKNKLEPSKSTVGNNILIPKLQEMEHAYQSLSISYKTHFQARYTLRYTIN